MANVAFLRRERGREEEDVVEGLALTMATFGEGTRKIE